MNNNPIDKLTCCPVSPVQTAVTPTVYGLKKFKNTFVEVEDINTTFYVSSSHQPVVISARPVYVDDYDYQSNPLNLRNQICYDFVNNRGIVYNAKGEYRLIELKEN